MSLDEAIRVAVADEVRKVLRAELPGLLEQLRGDGAPGEDGYLSVESAARVAEVHPDTIRAWVKARRLPEHRAGRELRIRRDELRAFLDQGGQERAAKPSAADEAARILARRR